jgi:transcription elongation GreA/GreB family factor
MKETESPNPTLRALRSITKARQVLEEVVESSESFNYRKAKEALKELQKMIRELGREEARLRGGLLYRGDTVAQVVPFPHEERETVNPG